MARDLGDLKSSASFLNCSRFITTLILLLQAFDIFTERRPEYPIFDWGGLVIGQEGLVFGQEVEEEEEEEAEEILILEVTAFINTYILTRLNIRILRFTLICVNRDRYLFLSVDRKRFEYFILFTPG